MGLSDNGNDSRLFGCVRRRLEGNELHEKRVEPL